MADTSSGPSAVSFVAALRSSAPEAGEATQLFECALPSLVKNKKQLVRRNQQHHPPREDQSL